MLGIIFTGGRGPPEKKIRLLLNAEAKDAVIAAADSGLETAEAAGVRPHWIIGDMDSLSDPAKLDAYPADRVLRYPADKDYTDTELAFYLLREKGCDEIWIIGGGGGRIDHLFGIRSLLEREIFPKRWILDTADIYCFEEAGLSANFQAGKNYDALTLRIESGSAVSVFPLGGGPWQALSWGLKWPLDKVHWNRGFIGLSNMAETGEFSILAKQGRFMVIIPRCEVIYVSDNY
jgi:thiamine pyrophosphokinase